MKVISFANLKGGTGKSSTAFNIIGIMAKKRKKVLVIDCDPQANMTNNFNVSDADDNLYYMDSVFDERILPTEVIIKRPIDCMATVDLMPSTITLTTSEIDIVGASRREYILMDYFEQHQAIFSRYDYIIIDTSPSLGLINQNAFAASDEILLVSDISYHGYKGCQLLIKKWDFLARASRVPNNINGIIVNRYDRRIKLSSNFINFVKENENLNYLTLMTYIPENVKVKESSLDKLPLAYSNTNNAAMKAYVELYKEMLERGIL